MGWPVASVTRGQNAALMYNTCHNQAGNGCIIISFKQVSLPGLWFTAGSVVNNLSAYCGNQEYA
jgi:hypothetical protein